MNKTIKVLSVGLFMTFLSVFSHARSVGSLINGIPVVAITNEELQSQINLLSNYGFSNLNLLSSTISYNPTTSGILNITFSCNVPGETDEYKIRMAIDLTYNSELNEFHIPSGGAKKVAHPLIVRAVSQLETGAVHVHELIRTNLTVAKW